MDLYYNDQKISQIPVVGQTTIGQIKKTLNDWLVPQGVTNYTIRLFFNNGTELSDVVFKTNTYDSSNFATQAGLLPGGSIRVNPVVAPQPAPVPVPQPAPVPVPQPTQVHTTKKQKERRYFDEAETFYLVKMDDNFKLFRTQADAYEWLYGEIGTDELDLEEPIDFDDSDVQETIDEFVEEDDENIAPMSVDLLE